MRYLAARLRTEKGKFLHVTELELYVETDTRGTVVRAESLLPHEIVMIIPDAQN